MPADFYPITGNPWWRKFSLQRSVGEVLAKRWAEAIVPFVLLVTVSGYFLLSTPQFRTGQSLATMDGELVEIGLLALALTIVLVGGAIDVSIGAMYGLVNIIAVILFKEFGAPVPVVALAAVGTGLLLGTINGVLVAYLKVRPFIGTLVTLLLFRTITEHLELEYTTRLAVISRDDPAWRFFNDGSIAGINTPLMLLLIVGVVVHLALSRLRFGWRVTAVGSSRTAARRVGMRLDRTTFAAFVISGGLAGLSGLLVATRLQQNSSSTGVGLELTVLTAVVLGGVSLSGGRGTAARALMGTVIVAVLSQGLALQHRDPNVFPTILAAILLIFATIDFKWGKNRSKALQKIYVVPGALNQGPIPDVGAPGSPWAINDRLNNALPIGLNLVDGPEDVVLDRQGRVYCGDRRGWIWRFSGPDHSESEIFAHVGGVPLGMQFDSADNLVVAIAGMGLYQVDSEGNSKPLSVHLRRSWHKLVDDSAVRLADDLDIAADGRIFFSDASTRFSGTEYWMEIMETRPNGRVLCYDPATDTTTVVVKNCLFPNGICVAHDEQSILVVSSVVCRVDRYWIDGPKKGALEPFMEDLPGIPDNINRASDGSYWLAFAGMRAPAFELSLRHPAMRRRMIKSLSADEYLMNNLNSACVAKVSESGEVLDCLWDSSQQAHPVITSMREFDGHLYLGGLTNNRVGKVRLTADQMEATV